MRTKRALRLLQELQIHSPHRFFIEFYKIKLAYHITIASLDCYTLIRRIPSPWNLILIHFLATILVVLYFHPPLNFMAYIGVYGAGLSSLLIAVSLGRFIQRTFRGVFILSSQ